MANINPKTLFSFLGALSKQRVGYVNSTKVIYRGGLNRSLFPETSA